jgi:DNA-binding NtrC family response regulator
VEDEAPVRVLVRDMLTRQGYTVLESSTPEEALAFCHRDPGSIHLLLTDMVMPQTTGPELAEKLKVLQPTMKVLYMSGYTNHPILRREVLQDGMSFIQKPFTAGSLGRKVRSLLDEGKKPDG